MPLARTWIVRAFFRRLVVASLLGAAGVGSGSGCARPPGPALSTHAEGWLETGSTVVEQDLPLITAEVYRIAHFVRRRPASCSRRDMIALADDKRFVLQFLRDVPRRELDDAIRHAYASNGYADGTKIDRALAVFARDLHEDDVLVIDWSAARRATRIELVGARTILVEGEDFMHATWATWFGVVDPPSIGDDLVHELIAR